MVPSGVKSLDNVKAFKFAIKKTSAKKLPL